MAVKIITVTHASGISDLVVMVTVAVVIDIIALTQVCPICTTYDDKLSMNE